jgi:hypothetical protein
MDIIQYGRQGAYKDQLNKDYNFGFYIDCIFHFSASKIISPALN